MATFNVLCNDAVWTEQQTLYLPDAEQMRYVLHHEREFIVALLKKSVFLYVLCCNYQKGTLQYQRGFLNKYYYLNAWENASTTK